MNLTLRTLAKVGAFSTAFAALTIVTACKKDSDNGPSTITVSSIKSGTTDLNGATAATNVSTSANIVITFSSDVDAATATSSNITLKTTDGTSTAATAVSTSGAIVTIDPSSDLLTGANYTLAIGTGVKGAKGASFAGQSVTFTTAGPKTVTPPQVANQVLYLNFNGNTNATTGGNPTAALDVTYGADRGGNANAAAVFNGTSTLIEYANGTPFFGTSQTFAFWLKLDTNLTHSHFVFGMDAFRGGQMEFNTKGDNFKHAGAFLRGATYNNDSLNFGDCWTGEAVGDRDGATALAQLPSGGIKGAIAAKWAHIVYSYNAATKTRAIYINGQPVIKHNYNNSTGSMKRVTAASYQRKADNPTETSNGFVLGFIKSRDAGLWATEPWAMYSNPDANHFKGMMDDFRVFSVALSDAEVSTLYNAEK